MRCPRIVRLVSFDCASAKSGPGVGQEWYARRPGDAAACWQLPLKLRDVKATLASPLPRETYRNKRLSSPSLLAAGFSAPIPKDL